MAGIPLINVVAVAHLFFIGVFFGVYATESVLELHSWFNRNDTDSARAVARSHFWIDTLVEIPVFLAIVATGVWLAFLVEQLTAWHWVLMGLAAALLPGGLYCVATVRRRHRLMLEQADPDQLRARSRRIILGTILFINPFLTGLLVLGFYLAWQRVLGSIYG